jgi:predicted ATP-binding protein involved in virulence
MRFIGLKLANLRTIDAAEFHFQPGFNLIVGVNGVGKSIVLDALRICASRLLPSMIESRAKAMTFAVDDIRSGLPFLDGPSQATVSSPPIARSPCGGSDRDWREWCSAS